MEEKRKKIIKQTLRDFNLTLLDFKINASQNNLYYFHGFDHVIFEGINHLLKLLYKTRS